MILDACECMSEWCTFKCRHKEMQPERFETYFKHIRCHSSRDTADDVEL